MIEAKKSIWVFFVIKIPKFILYGKESYFDTEYHKMGIMQIHQNLIKFSNSVEAPVKHSWKNPKLPKDVFLEPIKFLFKYPQTQKIVNSYP